MHSADFRKQTPHPPPSTPSPRICMNVLFFIIQKHFRVLHLTTNSYLYFTHCRHYRKVLVYEKNMFILFSELSNQNFEQEAPIMSTTTTRPVEILSKMYTVSEVYTHPSSKEHSCFIVDGLQLFSHVRRCSATVLILIPLNN